MFSDWFAPGYKGGGPITSALNLVSHMKDDLDIYLFTSDRDLGESVPYVGLETNKWIGSDHCNLFYASPDFLTWSNILGVIKTVSPDVVYINSMFSRYFAVYPMVMKWLGKLDQDIVLSPRGMLRSSALLSKSLKKKLFLSLLSGSGVMRKVRFHATDQQEKTDIGRIFGNEVPVITVGNFPGYQDPYKPPTFKREGLLKMIFVGRIHPIKNLHFLLECLEAVRSEIEFTIVGPVESKEYWQQCRDIIARLGKNIQIKFHSGLAHTEILNAIRENHVMALPTLGENFGHAIFESFACGRPVLISDQTPWINLERFRAGWDFSLCDKDKFISQIERLAEMGLSEYEGWCCGAWTYCSAYLKDSDQRKLYLSLFRMD